MSKRYPLIAACAAVAALTIGAVHITAESTVLSRREFLTFQNAVALPGVSLAPGTYVFELADPEVAGVVRVRDRATNLVKYTGFTYRINRLTTRRDSHVVLGEAPRGTPPPVIAWYPVDQDLGYKFIYRDGR